MPSIKRWHCRWSQATLNHPDHFILWQVKTVRTSTLPQKFITISSILWMTNHPHPWLGSCDPFAYTFLNFHHGLPTIVNVKRSQTLLTAPANVYNCWRYEHSPCMYVQTSNSHQQRWWTWPSAVNTCWQLLSVDRTRCPGLCTAWWVWKRGTVHQH